MNSNKKENNAPEPVRIIGDIPLKKDAGFGFNTYIDIISEMIAYKENETPLVIGVYGKWGTGKTTLMQSVQEKLDLMNKNENLEYDNEYYRKCETIWFQPWKYKNEDEILAALIEQIFKKMEQDGFFKELKGNVEKFTKRINKTKLFISFIKKITTIDVNEFFQELEYKKGVGFYDVFDKFFTDLIWTYLSWRPKINEFEEYDGKKGILAIFIDDLDRCPEPRIVNVLETIKLFMDKKGCIFVIGADNEIIVKALKKPYEKDAEKFMDKIVQVTFNLPKIPDNDFTPYFDKLETDIGNDFKDFKKYISIIIPALGNNPRGFKRFINNLSLLKGLVKKSKLTIKDKNLLLWSVIEKAFLDFHKILKKDGGLKALETMQHRIKKAETEKNDLFSSNEEDLKKLNIPEHLKKYLKDIHLVNIVKEFKIKKQDLEQLITLAEIIETPKKQTLKKQSKSEEHKVIYISKGKFIYQGEKDEVIDDDYEIDIYPVTNKQFKKFINANGYFKNEFWDESGLKWRKNNKNITEPSYFNDKRFNDPEQPVVGVSWYEANAYTKYMTSLEQNRYKYKLPNEKEWERAAAGDNGNIYPWGNEFDKDKCNTKESNLEKTNRVTLYSDGLSPDGCYDMVGNVLEWTSSFYNSANNSYVLRGGYFDLNSYHCRCANRYYFDPYDRYFFIGFRCARTITL